MDFKKNRDLFNEAISSGCKTIAELVLFLRAHTQLN